MPDGSMTGRFEALGDPTRRAILGLLAMGEQSAGAVVAAVQARAVISQPAVSQHLRVLREAGLITVRADGTRRLYALDEAGVTGAREWWSQLLDPAESLTRPLAALATEVSRGRRAAAAKPGTSGRRDTRSA